MSQGNSHVAREITLFILLKIPKPQPAALLIFYGVLPAIS